MTTSDEDVDEEEKTRLEAVDEEIKVLDSKSLTFLYENMIQEFLDDPSQFELRVT